MIDRINPQINIDDAGNITWVPSFVDYNPTLFYRGKTVTNDEFNQLFLQRTYQANYLSDSLNELLNNYLNEAIKKRIAAEGVSAEELNKALENYYDKDTIDNKLANISLDDYYDKTEVDQLIDTAQSAIPTKVSELENDSNFLTSVPSEYITESVLNNYYDKDAVNNALTQVTSNMLTTDTLQDIVQTKNFRNHMFFHAPVHFTENIIIDNISAKSLKPVSSETNIIKILDGVNTLAIGDEVNFDNLTLYSANRPQWSGSPGVYKDLALVSDIPDISNLATKDELPNLDDFDLSEYAKKTDIPDISNLADQDDIPTKVSELENDSGFITKAELPNIDDIDLNEYAKKADISAIINYGTNMRYGQNTQLDWYYKHQYLHFGEITTIGQRVLNLYSQSYNAGDYQTHTIYTQELVVVDISKGTGLSGSDVITFTPTKESYSGFYSNNMYHTLGTSNYDKQVVMSRYGVSKALEDVNKTIIRRWS